MFLKLREKILALTPQLGGHHSPPACVGVDDFLASWGGPPVQADLCFCLARSHIHARRTCVRSEHTAGKESGSARGSPSVTLRFGKTQLWERDLRGAEVCVALWHQQSAGASNCHLLLQGHDCPRERGWAGRGPACGLRGRHKSYKTLNCWNDSGTKVLNSRTF